MKIEIEKPVIPQFVADWIEKEKKCTPFHKSFARAISNIKHNDDWEKWEYKVGNRWSRLLATAWLHGYEIEQEALYYAKNKLTGQYLGDMASDEEWLYSPRWIVDKRDLHVEKLTKDEFRSIYGLDNTNADFERVE